MTEATNGSSLVLYEKSERVATITLNRPEKLNALSQGLYMELDAAVEKAGADANVFAVVLTGRGWTVVIP